MMARDTPHEAVYALTSGGGTTRRRGRPPSSPTPPPTVYTVAPAVDGHSSERKTTGEGREWPRRGSLKRIKVSPDPDFSGSETSVAVAVERDHTSTARHAQDEQPASSAPSSPPSLPVIQRGLRASRIVPVTDIEYASAESQPSRPPEKDPNSAYSQRNIHGEELDTGGGAVESQGPGRGFAGEGGGVDLGEGKRGTKVRVPSRPPPAVTNLDLSSSPNSVSSTSPLPPLELEVAPPLSLPPTPSSPASGGKAMVARDDESGRAGAPDDDIESNVPVVGGGGNMVDGRLEDEDGAAAEERASPAATVEATEAAEAAEAENLERNKFLGRRTAEKLRERLNRTFTPQGVEITAAMICSTELPVHIANQMLGRTLNASLAKEQRAVKRTETQQVSTHFTP